MQDALRRAGGLAQQSVLLEPIPANIPGVDKGPAEAAGAAGAAATLQDHIIPSQQFGWTDENTTATSTVPKDQPMLRWGSKGPAVERLQSLLNRTDEVTVALGVDGAFGPKTHQAVVEFQKANGLGMDGIVGPQTWGRLTIAEFEPQDPKSVAKKSFLRGAACYKKGDFAHAYDFFTSANERCPDKKMVFNRAQALRRLGGRREETLALYERYIAAGGSRSAEAQGYVIEVRGPGNTGDAEVDKSNAKAQFLAGAKHYKNGAYAHAYDSFTRAGEAFHDKKMLFNRGQALRRLGGRNEEAIALFEQYIAEGGARSDEAATILLELRGPAATGDEATDKASAKAQFAEGAAHYGAGEFAHAYDAFTRADRLRSRPSLTFNRAQSLRRLGGRREEAIALFEKYLAAGGARSDEASFYAKELRTQGAIDQKSGI